MLVYCKLSISGPSTVPSRHSSGLPRRTVPDLPIRAGGYPLDLDSLSLIREAGHQDGVRVGYTY